MISFFRRLIFSKLGIVVAGILFAIFGLSMVGGDVSGLRTQGLAALGGGGNDLIRVGKQTITPEELAQHVKDDWERYRSTQQRPDMTLAEYVSIGGFDATVNRQIDQLALDQFGERQGMTISKRAVDGLIASDPNLQGPDGQFDPNAFRLALQARKLTERGLRTDMARSMMAGQLVGPIAAAPATVPLQLALPYANLSLDRRAGTIAFVPTRAMPAGAPRPTPNSSNSTSATSRATPCPNGVSSASRASRPTASVPALRRATPTSPPPIATTRRNTRRPKSARSRRSWC